MLKVMIAIVVGGLCLACRSDDVDLRVSVIVPAEIPSVSSGVLRMSLWAYDPNLMDAPASKIDATSTVFAHTKGESNQLWMSVRGKVPSGARYYIGVDGFEVLPTGEKRILWDGLECCGAPATVVMRSIVNVGWVRGAIRLLLAT
jgi:hypothetical protein